LKDAFDYIFNNTKIDSATVSKYSSLTEMINEFGGPNTISLVNLEFLKSIYKEGFSQTTSGNFSDALTSFQKCIQHAAISAAANLDEETEIKKLISSCVEYIIAMKTELRRRDKAVTTTEQENLALAWIMST